MNQLDIDSFNEGLRLIKPMMPIMILIGVGVLCVMNFGGSSPNCNKLCRNCGFVGHSKKYIPGWLWVELLLYVFGCMMIFMLVPAIGFSIYRRCNKYYGCPRCKAPYMVPANSPVVAG